MFEICAILENYIMELFWKINYDCCFVVLLQKWLRKVQVGFCWQQYLHDVLLQCLANWWTCLEGCNCSFINDIDMWCGDTGICLG
jgi:hypothetical protein